MKMRLIMVSLVEDFVNLNDKLKVSSILNREYKSESEVYKDFRKLVPVGRYALFIAFSDEKLVGIDTQVIEKRN